jgi:hypothetical protein
MRYLALAALAIGAIGVGGTSPAAARDYPYCLQSRSTGIPGDCSYQSYAQCMQSASGRAASCNINPRVAFQQQQQQWNGRGGYRY